MRELLVSNPASLGLLIYLILGAAYYMAATILMKGSIFEGMRKFIESEARWSGFFDFLKRMLGCMMCTATELSLWTAGLMTFIFGLYFHIADEIFGALMETLGAIEPGQAFLLSWWMEIPAMFAVSIAVSFAIAAEAWIIKTFFEHRERKFLALREEFRRQETDLLSRLASLRRKIATGEGNVSLTAKEILIPLPELTAILESLKPNHTCRWIWCDFSRTTCFVRQTNEGIRKWIIHNQIDPEAMNIYDLVLKNSIRVENALYWCFWAPDMRPPGYTHIELARAIEDVLVEANIATL